MNTDGPIEEEARLRQFFAQAGLPSADPDLHADHTRWVPPGPKERPMRRWLPWMGVGVSLAAVMGLFLSLSNGGVPATQSAAGPAAVTHGHQSASSSSSPSRVAVAVVVTYLKQHHQPMHAVMGASRRGQYLAFAAAQQPVHKGASPHSNIWQVSMANPVPDRQDIAMPATRFYVNVKTHRVVQTLYGPINRTATDRMALQWARHHMPTGSVNQAKVVSTQKISTSSAVGWTWQVKWRSSSGVIQVITISPQTGWIQVVNG